MIKIKYDEYLKLVESGATTHLHGVKSNRARTIKYNGEIFSAELFYNTHGYDWRAYPNGAEWYYRSESGQQLTVSRRK